MKTNMEIATAWKNGIPAQNRSMTTDGKTLWSYAMPIGATEDGKKIAIYAGVSTTTSKHMIAAMRKADIRAHAYDTRINPSSTEIYHDVGSSAFVPNLRIPRIGVTYLVWWDSKVYKTLRGAENKAFNVGGIVREVRGGYRIAYLAVCGEVTK